MVSITGLQERMKTATSVEEWNEIRDSLFSEYPNDHRVLIYWIDMSGMIVKVLGRDRRRRRKKKLEH